MNKSIVMGKRQQYLAVGLSVILSFLVVWAVAFGSSTISGNISTGGTLTVTGASTLSSTLAVTGAATLSSTLDVTGLTTLGFASSTSISLTQNLMVNKMATTTGSTGNFATEGTITSVGNIGAGTTTPATEISALGAATTTAYITSSGSGIGGCIELKGTNGTNYKMYVGGGETATTTTSGRVGFTAIWIAGSCK